MEEHNSIFDKVQQTVSEVFSTMLGLEVQNGIVETEPHVSTPKSGVVAMVGLAGAVSGNGCIYLDKDLACHLSSRFLMAEYTKINDDVMDAVAELANMIVGGLKTELEENLGPMGLSVPTVLFAENYITRNSRIGNRYLLNFTCVDGDWSSKFAVLICLITEKSNRSYLNELAEFHVRL
jgi:chemotaxis protein CheX